MSLNNFIPQLWGDTLLAALRADLVFGNLINRDYEGEIKSMGDTVRINGIGDITVSSYVKDTDIASPQALTDAQTVLTISQAKYFNFAIDDVDAAQQHPKVMQEAMSYAAYKIALGIDQYLAGFYTEASASNLVGSSGSPTTVTVPTQANVGIGTTVYDELMSLAQFLTQSLVPRQGRFVVIPPWCKTHLTQDVRFTGFNTADARQSIQQYGFDPAGSDSSGSNDSGRGGPASDAYLGMIDSMRVYESVNAPHIGGTVGIAGSQDAIIAGHPMAWTYADGVNKTEAYRPPLRFSDAVKGLHLYGAKVTRPYALAVAFLQKP
jgi:hypothetical protein